MQPPSARAALAAPARIASAGTALWIASLAACSGTAPVGPVGAVPEVAPRGTPAPSNLRYVTLPARPRLALLARDGDPAPALVAVVATDLGSAPTVALAAVIEARLLAAGLPVDTRVDRNAFRVRLVGSASQASPKAFFGALAEAFRAPLGPGTPEVARASERLLSLRRNPLPAPEAAPAADCAGRLGVSPRERVLDPLTPEGLGALEAARAQALTASRTALAVVGPAALGADAERALSEIKGWIEGPAPAAAWPAADTSAAFAAHDVAKGRARITVAVRVGEPAAAVSAADRLADPHGPLRSRLSALPLPFRVTEVLGVAHPRGGCVSITAEADESTRETPIAASALAAAVARKEIGAEAHAPPEIGIAAQAVVSATDPREAAARAAWWALSGAAAGEADRWSTLLALAPEERSDSASFSRRFDADLTAALRASEAPVVERKPAFEKGQGEVWVLLASPCGTSDEGPYDAGTSALAALAVTARERRYETIAIEPWITPEGVGLIAHGPTAAGDDEAALARRVTSAAARAFAGEMPIGDAIGEARASALMQIEKTAGPHGAALDGLLGALASDHPSQLHPLGTFARLAAVGAPSVTARWQAIANGPLRMAILANGSAAQATEAFAQADHWLAPRAAPHPCPAATDASLRPGRYEVELPAGAELSQALLAAPVAARGQTGRELAELAAQILGGERGLVQAALDHTPLPAVASVRLLGGARTAALVIDVRAPAAALDDAVAETKTLLDHLGKDGPSEQNLELGRSKKQHAAEDASFDPRSRLVKLWLSETAQPAPAPTRASMQAFFASAFREAAVVLVEAKHK